MKGHGSQFDRKKEAAIAALLTQRNLEEAARTIGISVTTLLKVMVEPGTPPSTKVRAADSILDHSAKAIELEDIEARVAELERAAQAAKENRR